MLNKNNISRRNAKRGIFMLWGLLIICGNLTTCLAQANLVVIPKRVVFEGNKRTQEINLGNGSNDSAQYTISIVEMKMKPDGSFEEVKTTDSSENYASGHLRVYPRYVNLGPSESQNVKVQLVNTKNLAPGEYRSHILIKTAPKKKPANYKKLEKMVTNLAVKLSPIFAVTIPVIIRVGAYNATLNISDVTFKMATSTDGNNRIFPELSGTFVRSGKMSVYGNLSIEHINPAGQTTHVGLVKGLAIYTPNTTRSFKIELDNNLGVDYSAGKLHLTFNTQIEDRFVRMTDAEVSLP